VDEKHRATTTRDWPTGRTVFPLSTQVRRQKALELNPASLVLERPIAEYGEYEIPLWIRGYARGEHALPVIVRKRL